MSKYHIVGNHMSWLNYRRGGGWGGAAVIIFRSHQRILRRAVQTSHEKQLDPIFKGTATLMITMFDMKDLNNHEC